MLVVVLVAKRGGGVRSQGGCMLSCKMMVYVIGPTWGLTAKMACYLDLANEE